jgi:hypothetical protein
MDTPQWLDSVGLSAVPSLRKEWLCQHRLVYIASLMQNCENDLKFNLKCNVSNVISSATVSQTPVYIFNCLVCKRLCKDTSLSARSTVNFAEDRKIFRWAWHGIPISSRLPRVILFPLWENVWILYYRALLFVVLMVRIWVSFLSTSIR